MGHGLIHRPQGQERKRRMTTNYIHHEIVFADHRSLLEYVAYPQTPETSSLEWGPYTPAEDGLYHAAIHTFEPMSNEEQQKLLARCHNVVSSSFNQ
jgi:hypothetical protein